MHCADIHENCFERIGASSGYLERPELIGHIAKSSGQNQAG
jgi:hypothetical protein